MNTTVRTFRLAPMCRVILILTSGLFALPVVFLGNAVLEKQLGAVALFLIAIYAWVWLRFRPTRFVVHPGVLEVVWPLKRREIPRDGIS